eukprot:CAMPEP_0178446416 /NCGR_PEP_ID=MMETSP0689_2-20121128/40790_1 /TAXON_ID=160604 /ORGANISM="Amphidinium massartii, Strain CS-259" /LENGTH=210 /DNA_ID=CAMNT_0020071235 /DNA_START=189 /DNA_END=818 /DNA_ORIENTATION=-
MEYQIEVINWDDPDRTICKADSFTFSREKDGQKRNDRGWHDLLAIRDMTKSSGWLGPNNSLWLRAELWLPKCCSSLAPRKPPPLGEDEVELVLSIPSGPNHAHGAASVEAWSSGGALHWGCRLALQSAPDHSDKLDATVTLNVRPPDGVDASSWKAPRTKCGIMLVDWQQYDLSKSIEGCKGFGSPLCIDISQCLAAAPGLLGPADSLWL